MAKLTAQEALGRAIEATAMLGYVSFEVVSQVIIKLSANYHFRSGALCRKRRVFQRSVRSMGLEGSTTKIVGSSHPLLSSFSPSLVSEHLAN